MKPEIERISSRQVSVLLPYHYLIKESKGFRSGYNYGGYIDGNLQAVCIFHSPSVPEIVKGCFGLQRTEQKGIFELGRLVKYPDAHDGFVLSQFVALAIKQLRKDAEVNALLSYADSRYHTGFIYQALNFRYYGLTTPKSDWWFLNEDGTYRKHHRGKVKGTAGEWRRRSRKHRYLMVYDKSLNVRWTEEPYPKSDNIEYIMEPTQAGHQFEAVWQ
jgi:hypothetical protein